MGIGLLAGAMAVGSATTHLLIAAGGIENWRRILFLASAVAALGALIVLIFIVRGHIARLLFPIIGNTLLKSSG